MVLPAPARATDVLTAAQIAWYAGQAGFTGNDVAIATAIALAESSGKIAAKGGPNRDGSYDYGLWQINGKAHPDLIKDDTQWWVAGFNAQMAYKIWSAGRSFRPWSTFNSGAYLIHLPAAKAGAAWPKSSGEIQGQVDTGTVFDGVLDPVANAIDSVLGPLEGLANAVKAMAGIAFKTAAWVATPANAPRVAFIGIGGVLVVGALLIVARPAIMGAAAPLVNAATDVVPGGGIAKKVAKTATKAAAKGATQ